MGPWRTIQRRLERVMFGPKNPTHLQSPYPASNHTLHDSALSQEPRGLLKAKPRMMLACPPCRMMVVGSPPCRLALPMEGWLMSVQYIILSTQSKASPMMTLSWKCRPVVRVVHLLVPHDSRNLSRAYRHLDTFQNELSSSLLSIFKIKLLSGRSSL